MDALPPRTVPESVLRFTSHAIFSPARYAAAIPEQSKVGDFKVSLHVKMQDLGLTLEEEARLLVLVGPRYDRKKREIKLVSDRFPSRVENKRYLVYLLENLLLEARKKR